MEKAREAIKQIFLEPDFIKSLQELLAPAIEAAVKIALDKQDEKIADLKENVTESKNKLAQAEEKLAATQDRLKEVEQQVEQLEAENRKGCLVISGVPELPDEDTSSLVLDVARAAGVTLAAGDLDRSHRLGRQRGSIDKPRAILAKFGTYNKRQALFGQRKELSGHRVCDHPVLTRQVLENVFISDFLTTKAQNTLFICRQLKKQKQLWAAYSTNGKVKVRVAENQPPRTVSDTSELQTIIGPDNPHLQTLLAGQGTAPRSRVAGAVGGRDANASGQGRGPAAGYHPDATKERRQSPRLAVPSER